MARQLVAASAMQMAIATPIVTGYPFSVGCWFWADTAPGVSWLLTGYTSPLTQYWGIPTVGSILRAQLDDGTGAASASTTATFTTGIWQQALAVFASATSRTIYLNGGNAVTNTTSKNFPAITNFVVGQLNNGSYFDGRVAEVGVWTGALTADEAAALGRGVSPLRVQPTALLDYWPLYGTGSPERSMAQGQHGLTLTNTPSQVAHAPVMAPLAGRLGWRGAFGGATRSLILARSRSARALLVR